MKSLLILVLFALLGNVFSRSVFRVEVSNKEELDRLLIFTDKYDIDIWTTPGQGPVDILVPSHLQSQIETLNLQSSLLISNVDELILEEKLRIASRGGKFAFFDEYQTLDSIYQWVRQLAASYPSLVSTFVLGKSYEGRDILGLKIRANRGASKEFFFNGGVHSREWINPATVLYMTNELVTKYGKDSNVTKMIDSLDWTIIPIVNPDGYIHTFSSDRLWRKNRQPNSGSICVGTDLNRNFPFKWNTGGSSANPCSDSFHGPNSGSAPETKALTGYLSSNAGRIVGYIDFHAYSQLLMFPWGYSTTLTPDNAAFKRVGDAAAAALRRVYGTVYEVGSIANIIYVASGSSADYTYGQLGIRWSFAYELRDKGRYGFILPPDQIIPSGIETFESLKVLVFEGVLSNL